MTKLYGVPALNKEPAEILPFKKMQSGSYYVCLLSSGSKSIFHFLNGLVR